MGITKNSNSFCQATDRPLNKGSFAADATAVTAAAQYIPVGGALTKTATGAGLVVTSDQTIIGQFRLRFTGSGSNVGGQTATFQLSKNGTPITSATSAAIPTTAGVQSANVDFSAAGFSVADGDLIQCTLTPSATLTAVLTDISVSLG